MTGSFTRETFVRPAELDRRQTSIAAQLYNRCRLLLRHSRSGFVFVPIRSMQYQAVIEDREIFFVDLQGGYVTHQGERGRPIILSWLLPSAAEREALDAPVTIELVRYRDDAEAIHRRLCSEFPLALMRAEQQKRSGSAASALARILPLPTRE